MMNFKEGDSYIQFTKYGGVNRGKVDRIRDVQVVDVINRVIYQRISIVNEKGISYDLDGSDGQFFLVNSEMSEEQCDRYKTLFEKIKSAKRT
jgi:hypothetical protein